MRPFYAGRSKMVGISRFFAGYNEMRRRFPDSQVICMGKRLDGMGEDICYVDYAQSFGSFDSKQDFWQVKLFNWDFSEVK